MMYVPELESIYGKSILWIVVLIAYCVFIKKVLCSEKNIAISEPVGIPKTHVLDRCNVNTSDNQGKRIDGELKMAYPPKGTGLFKDPVEVLGPLFPTKKSINTCEIHISLIADTTSDMRFTRRGEKTCSDVCIQYKTNMITDGPVEVTLLQGYCDYSNTVEMVEKIDLATTCTCVYRVTCDSRSSLLMTYFFQADCNGFIKVSMSEANKSQPIT